MEKTFGEIYKDFLKIANINKTDVDDFRPCTPPFIDVFIQGTILVWLKNGDRIIYIPKTNIKSEKE